MEPQVEPQVVSQEKYNYLYKGYKEYVYNHNSLVRDNVYYLRDAMAGLKGFIFIPPVLLAVYLHTENSDTTYYVGLFIFTYLIQRYLTVIQILSKVRTSIVIMMVIGCAVRSVQYYIIRVRYRFLSNLKDLVFYILRKVSNLYLYYISEESLRDIMNAKKDFLTNELNQYWFGSPTKSNKEFAECINKKFGWKSYIIIPGIYKRLCTIQYPRLDNKYLLDIAYEIVRDYSEELTDLD